MAVLCSSKIDAKAIMAGVREMDKGFKGVEVVEDKSYPLPVLKDEQGVEHVGHVDIIKFFMSKMKKPLGIPKNKDNEAKMWDWIGFGVELSGLIRLENYEAIYPRLLELKSALDTSMYLADTTLTVCDAFLHPYLHAVLKQYSKKFNIESGHSYPFALRYFNLLCTVLGKYKTLPLPTYTIPEFVAAQDMKKGKGGKK